MRAFIVPNGCSTESALHSAADKLATDEFKGQVAIKLSEDDEFRRKIIRADGFQKSVAELLVAGYADKLRRPAGAAGPAGPPGANGTSPSTASVAEALDNDGAFRTKVADLLVAANGRAPGEAGKDGASLNAEEVASILINKHGDQLRQLLASKPLPRPGPRRHR
jgi:hypothetical protein